MCHETPKSENLNFVSGGIKMRLMFYLVIGVLFGITMSQSQAASWYRIQEMFRFESFHMFGIIGVAVVSGIIGTALIKKWGLKDRVGNPIRFADKQKSVWRYLLGGTLFGLGWALSGACPGPMVVLIGQGWISIVVVLLFAVLGTWTYGLIRHKLPHSLLL
jgi:uncharacterized protein